MRYKAGDRIDHYEVTAPLGAGAYAETYRAEDLTTGNTVVLKCPNPNLFADPGLFQRYRRETVISRRLDHPGVQRSLDDGQDRSEPYLVLEYVDGDNLRRHLRSMSAESHPLPIETVTDWGRQLAATLAYMHGMGIVHRDLKPENTLITRAGQLKVADFGTALLAGARRLTYKHLSEGLGTPDYMSPEQIQGERGDTRSDIYAWGVMMYEFLTGRVPFPGDNWLAAMASHLRDEPVAIHQLRRGVPPALEAVVLRAMRRYPENRYPSAEALLADLDRLDELDPLSFDLSPEPPMGGMAAVDSARRLWLLVGLVAAGFVALVALIIVLSILLR